MILLSLTIFIFFFSKVSVIQARGLFQDDETPLPNQTELFSDTFDRADNAVVGNAWVEVETTGAQVGIQGNRMCFLDTSDVANRPIVSNSFQQVNSGELTWQFNFDWSRTGTERTYRHFMQLGQGSIMNDTAPNDGVGINLVWTALNNVQETLAYRKGGVDTSLTTVSGPAVIQVTANLDTNTYQVTVNGTAVGSALPFDSDVNLDTVRYLTDGLNEIFFAGRCFDNVSISTNGISPTATPTETPTSTATPSSTPDLPTDTPTPTSSSTPEPSATPTSTTEIPTDTPTSTFSPSPTPSPTSDPPVITYRRKEIVLTGPSSVGMGNPNPFLIEAQVTFTGPTGQTFVVPAFYDGDGNGGMDGNVWKVRFAPDIPGTWTYSFDQFECPPEWPKRGV